MMAAEGGTIITLDVDWAPDFVLRYVADRLRQAGRPSTWFVTHPSPVWDELRREPALFELGIHPNFAPGSSQGDAISRVLSHLMAIVPEARCARSHGLYQSGHHLAVMHRETPIRLDSSLFLPEHPHLQPVRHLTPTGTLHRIPIYWADDYELMKPQNERWTRLDFASGPGLQVLMFHPIHIYLNTCDFADYEAIKQRVGNLSAATESELALGRQDGIGVGAFFDRCLERSSSQGERRFLTEKAELDT